MCEQEATNGVLAAESVRLFALATSAQAGTQHFDAFIGAFQLGDLCRTEAKFGTSAFCEAFLFANTSPLRRIAINMLLFQTNH
jgi:hypothetical protein